MSLKTICVPQPSVFASDRRATVLSLDTVPKGQIQGKQLFEENYFTIGVQALIDRAFRQLASARRRLQWARRRCKNVWLTLVGTKGTKQRSGYLCGYR